MNTMIGQTTHFRRSTGWTRMTLLAMTAAFLASGCGGGGGNKAPAPTPDPDPVASTITPSSGTVGTEVEIVGTNFRTSVTASAGGVTLGSLDRVSSTQLFGFIPDTPGSADAGTAVDIVVRNSDGTSTTMQAAFTFVDPTLSYVNSATKPSGNIGSTVIIDGDAFGDLQGTGQVLFSDGLGGTIPAVIAAEDDWINDFIVTTVPAGTEDGPIVIVTATGTSNELPFNVTSNATFSPSEIEWFLTAALPVGLSGHTALHIPIDDANGVTNNFVHVFGGAVDFGTPVAGVNVALVNADGSLGDWAAIAPLPAGRAFHAAVAATPFNSKVPDNGEVYVLGGIDMVGGQPVTIVYRATLDVDGTLKEILDAGGIGTGEYWSETTPLPEAMHSMGIAIFRGAIYAVGGATTTDNGDGTFTDNVPVASVYRARPDEFGELSAWETMTSLPSARAYHDVQTFGGFLYSVGGESAAVTPDDGNFATNDTKLNEVAYVAVNLRNGDIDATDWTINENSLSKNRSKHSMLVAGGNIFVSSGLYSGIGPSGSSENTFAQISADGTVGTFTGATGVNTLNEASDGINLFNQAAISYTDAAGAARVMILGGENVDVTGVKVRNVLYY